MPLLNFKKQFAPLVEAGAKRQTIRAKRSDGLDPRVGQTLYFSSQTTSCRKLGEAICKSVQQITIDQHGINIAGDWLTPVELDNFSIADGFASFYELRCFFNQEHGLPFEGLLYKW
jgi:hypothetical protein